MLSEVGKLTALLSLEVFIIALSPPSVIIHTTHIYIEIVLYQDAELQDCLWLLSIINILFNQPVILSRAG